MINKVAELNSSATRMHEVTAHKHGTTAHTRFELSSRGMVTRQIVICFWESNPHNSS